MLAGPSSGMYDVEGLGAIFEAPPPPPPPPLLKVKQTLKPCFTRPSLAAAAARGA